MVTVRPRMLLGVYVISALILTTLLFLAVYRLEYEVIAAVESGVIRYQHKLPWNLTISFLTLVFGIHAVFCLMLNFLRDMKFNDSGPPNQYVILLYFFLSVSSTIYALTVGIRCEFTCIEFDGHHLIVPLTSWTTLILVLARFFAIVKEDDGKTYIRAQSAYPELGSPSSQIGVCLWVPTAVTNGTTSSPVPLAYQKKRSSAPVTRKWMDKINA
ncbi:hypothetical protein M3Y94_00898600 [Aphelenchoides besseyi]|nr:hypothetical protein M3Y94_00898600 [Aphelenchoides besseyi]KAI6223373.1 hypothetical protein M3Y95_00883400 [Aphelenchoides besseyi]